MRTVLTTGGLVVGVAVGGAVPRGALRLCRVMRDTDDGAAVEPWAPLPWNEWQR